MEKLKPLEEGKQDEEKEEMKPMPFGLIGIQILCNVTQYAVFLGLTVGILAIIQVMGRR